MYELMCLVLRRSQVILSNFPFKMAFLFKPVRSELRKAFNSYRSYYDDEHTIWTETMQINTKRFYTSKEVSELYEMHEWMRYDADEYECFESYCGWCYEPRWESCPADDNEHDECDLRLHYHSEEGIMEQEKTLIELKPALPSVVVDRIMQFLLPITVLLP